MTVIIEQDQVAPQSNQANLKVKSLILAQIERWRHA